MQFFGLVAAITILGGLVSMPTRATTRTVALTAVPAVIDTGGAPGEEIPVSFRLMNKADAPLPIQLATRSVPVKNGQTPEEAHAMDAKDWILFAQPDFVLEASETKIVSATIRIPSDASPGGHYADIVASSLSPENDEAIIAAQPELVVQALVSVSGAIKESLQSTLKSPATVIASRSSKNELSFEVTNQGTIHTIFQPSLTIRRDEDDVTTVHLSPVILLPKESRRITFSIPKDLPAGIYHAQMQTHYGTPAQTMDSTEVRIIMLPFSPLVLLLVPVIALIIYAIRIRKRVVSAVKIIVKG